MEAILQRLYELFRVEEFAKKSLSGRIPHDLQA